MPLEQQQQLELDEYLSKVDDVSPPDFIQFSANYFNKRLEQQREFIKNQERLAIANGIILFPAPTRTESNAASASVTPVGGTRSDAMRKSSVLFKSPFSDEDPHSTHTDAPIEAPPAIHSSSSGTAPSTGGIFRGDFAINQSAPGKRITSPMDPSKGSSSDHTQIPTKGDTPHFEQHMPMRFNAERRTSVSGESLQPDNFDGWTPDHYAEKSAEQLKRLEVSIGKNFLFNKLDSDSKKLVINCLEEKKVKKGDTIIKQGDEGDYFYVVEVGSVEFYVDDQKVSNSGPGSSFGELALMYNSPRAATVLASSDCTLWALDRLTFRKILLGSSFKKRVMYDSLLKSIPILENLTNYDRAKLADALDTQYYEPGQVILHEGDPGENFYLIEYGECEVTKEGKGLLTTLHDRDYFGEIALLKDVPRQATVTAVKKTKVATLGRSGFQRLLGPAVEILKLNDPTNK